MENEIGYALFLLFMIPIMIGLAIGVGRLTYNMVTTTTGWAIMIFAVGMISFFILVAQTF